MGSSAPPDDLAAVRLHLIRTLLDGRPAPTVVGTASALRLDATDVAAAYRRLADAHLVVLHPGTLDVWMAHPISAVPTDFRVRTEDRDVWGNCVWDGLGILALLHQDGRVNTRCPDCDAALDLTVTGGELVPTSAVVHFAVPAARWWEDIGHT